MGGEFDWTEIEQRCRIAKRRLDTNVDDTLSRHTGVDGEVHAPSTQTPNAVKKSEEVDGSDEGDAVVSVNVLSDESPVNTSVSLQSPLPAPPLTPFLPPPPLSIQRKGRKNLAAAAAASAAALSAHQLPPQPAGTITVRCPDGTSVPLLTSSSSSNDYCHHRCGGRHSAGTAKATKHGSKSEQGPAVVGEQRDPYGLGRRHTRCTNTANSHNDTTVATAAAETTCVAQLLRSLRRLDAVRSQRAAVAARSAEATVRLADLRCRLYEVGVSLPSSALASTLPTAKGVEREGSTTLKSTNTSAQKAATTHELLVRQLRASDRVNDELRRRYEALQQEKRHAVTLRDARLRRHTTLPQHQHQQHTAAGADVGIRSLSPICDASCSSRLTSPISRIGPALMCHTNDSNRPHHALDVHAQLRQGRLQPWEDRQAAALRQKKELRSLLELAMARERGRQTARVQLRSRGFVTGEDDDDVAVEKHGCPPSPSVQLM
ncbi:hypothetical protein ABB37_06993 [Leptomonas pyrrhocoris]|uniref:Uncharacterized protein n=1 Tax=Leptomonas pyrrhocoris TaxID=157538 RepID=A0A0M9FWX7_LEPPY|nr:hypothetical protein ABB37_06993 [Leptomonas pyrrhocoris]KPA77637.1 hypothetical protein ABB37_06993 [Leptomonas pyrrhocoris]|eukprot:XP_015656076.1 hypothetical protein ABB37_06993 [Leptomonas pyrrhocoris]